MFKKILLIAITVMMYAGAVQAGSSPSFCTNPGGCQSGRA
jgi:hypothetical protein